MAQEEFAVKGQISPDLGLVFRVVGPLDGIHTSCGEPGHHGVVIQHRGNGLLLRLRQLPVISGAVEAGNGVEEAVVFLLHRLFHTDQRKEQTVQEKMDRQQGQSPHR